MGQILHECAKTTEAVHRTLQKQKIHKAIFQRPQVGRGRPIAKRMAV